MKILPRLLLAALLLTTPAAAAPVTDAPFFDPLVPVHGSPVSVNAEQLLTRGLLIRIAPEEWVIFDQELLRPAMWLPVPAGKDPVTLETMAQRSWHEPTRKAGAKQPVPTAEGKLLAPALPGVGFQVKEILKDPRPVLEDEAGRGSLFKTGRRFAGYRFAGEMGVLTYFVGRMSVEEWYQPTTGGFERHLRVSPGETIFLLMGRGRLEGRGAVLEGDLRVNSPLTGAVLEAHEGNIIARVPGSAPGRRFSVEYLVERKHRVAGLSLRPVAPIARWASTVAGAIQESERTGPGWTLDRIALPEENSWKRRVRPADIVFKNEREAYIVTFDGDVWSMVLRGKEVLWRRFAGGLSEPLSIEMAGGVPQVFTRNGLIRLHDQNGDGEADVYQVHSDAMFQTESTRGYPLDMEVDADGRTWCSIGGISMKGKSLGSAVPSSPHAGGIVEISANGTSVETIATRAREPFFARDTVAGRIAMSEQQGNFVPASGIFPVVPGANFGYGTEEVADLALPSVWIPHEADTSSASPLWMRGSAFKEWEGGLLNLSYGTGRLFLVRPAGGWPAPRGAAIPLEIETGVPLLHGRVHPADGSIWFAGFRVYDSRVPDLQGIARLRPAEKSLAAPVDARVFADGVVMRFATPLKMYSVGPESIRARSWQYKRTKAYGSPRLKQDGTPGTDAVPSGQVFLSRDERSVFVHMPSLKDTMQLEVRYDFQLSDGTPTKGPVYFTARALEPMPWEELGFEVQTPNPSRAIIRESPGVASPASADAGKEIAMRMGCIACHSTNGATEGHSGPTWKGLFGAERPHADGSKAKADEAYLEEAILQPA
ncbi:MAG: c-type cytochrome, partial [Chthoniobacteraceae bacterium]